MGYILLEGGAEFDGMMAQPDLRSLALAGDRDVPVSIIPAAAAPDHNHIQAGQNGVRWFQKLGATRVTSLPLIDKESANRKELAEALRDSRLIYILGGFPGYLVQTLRDSLCWRAIIEAHRKGAVIGGSSAGAMVLCEYLYVPSEQALQNGLNLLSGTSVIPHYDTFGQGWMNRLSLEYPDILYIGIDEETGMINEGPRGQWHVYGKGRVTLYRRPQFNVYSRGESFVLK
ncbi:MAG TPA: Type 1 glutamine amidotransferase-like domain-containing protein [Thermodesulfobacteriota bacterium]|nr:Type 1 glutamine amidotransferase-like domain-containing protein [Thermodesulfobacteriota bacterium]